MTMSSPFVALVVSHDDGRILTSDLAGRPAGNYLIDRLSAPTAARRTIVVTAATPVPAVDIGEDLLIVDARAWVAEETLEQAAAQAVNEKRPVCLRAADIGEPTVAAGQVLAVWVPAAARDAWANLTGPYLDRSTLASLLLGSGTVDATVPVKQSAVEPARCLDSMVTLAEVERTVLSARAIEALNRGVRIRDPRHVYVRGRLTCGADVEIDVGVVIEGDVVLGDGVRIGAYAILRNATIGDRTEVRPYSIVEESAIGAAGQVGPYARIRPGTTLGERVQIGNYVEIKGSRVGNGSRINHHSFIGDADLGDDTTIGAGTITCNHDGAGVTHTIIEERAYIGSGCRLVAPVRIGHAATVGAGSTITHNVPPAKLAVARARQVTIERWRGPRTRRKPE